MKTKIQLLITCDSKLITLIRVTLLLLSIAWNVNCFGQDTLFMKDGKQISGLVQEISSTEIMYKRQDNINGPIYSILKNDVDKIKYSNGSVNKLEYQKPWFSPDTTNTPVVAKITPVFLEAEKKHKLKKIGLTFFLNNEAMNETEMNRSLLQLNNSVLTNDVSESKRARVLTFIGFAAIPCALGALYTVALTNSSETNTIAGRFLIGGAICIGTSIAAQVSHHERVKRIMKLYNQLD